MASSSDVRDVLNIPDGTSGGPRPSKKQKVSAAHPNLKGLAREVQNLGGDNPIAIVPQTSQFKKRRLASRKPAARWELRQFRNSARDDPSLILRHWRRKEMKQEHPQDQTPAAATAHAEGDATGETQNQEGGTQTETQTQSAPAEDEIEDSAFAKYNVHVSVPRYTDEQYQQTLQHSDWTKEETDYLMELAADFDLRWPLIWDRYEWTPPATNGSADADGDESKAIIPTAQTRSMEDLKGRYYEVAAKMMAIHKPVQYMSQAEYALHEVMAHYNPLQEKARKDFAINSLNRSREEAREEESLLLEIKRILARGERFNEERRELYNRLDYPHGDTDISTFKSSTGLQTLLQNLMNVDKSKKRKSIMGGADGASPAGQGTPQAAASQEPAPTKKEAAAAANNRESTGATSTPTGAGKKGGAQQAPTERRKLTEQEEAIYGVTHHDRLGSGPTFRTEKINKLFSHKSNQQQLRINNTLNELDVPIKLAMPTSATTQQFEALLGAVNGLLDARKVSDKLDAEIKIELAKKAEREKDNTETEKGEDEGKEGDEGEKKEDGVEATAEPSTEEAGNEEQATATVENGDDEEEADGNEESKEEQGEEETGAAEADETATPAEPEKDKERLGSRGPAHKRSASVLSTMSDKSAKRQKK